MNYSNQDFTGQVLSDRQDMDNQFIEGSCFSQCSPDVHVFPDTMVGTTFSWCNLDNVYIPPGNTIGDGCSTRRYMTLEDGNDWEVDQDNNPIKILGT